MPTNQPPPKARIFCHCPPEPAGLPPHSGRLSVIRPSPSLTLTPSLTAPSLVSYVKGTGLGGRSPLLSNSVHVYVRATILAVPPIWSTLVPDSHWTKSSCHVGIFKAGFYDSWSPCSNGGTITKDNVLVRYRRAVSFCFGPRPLLLVMFTSKVTQKWGGTTSGHPNEVLGKTRAIVFQRYFPKDPWRLPNAETKTTKTLKLNKPYGKQTKKRNHCMYLLS